VLDTQTAKKGKSMRIVRVTENEETELTPEQIARLNALADSPDEDIDYSDIPERTEEDWARSVRISDYPSIQDARREARHLSDLQRAGMGTKELNAYKLSRIRQPTTV